MAVSRRSSASGGCAHLSWPTVPSRLSDTITIASTVDGKAIGRKLLNPFLGRRRFQPVFQALHEVALAGLNFGDGNDVYGSGELVVLRHIRDRHPRERPLTIFDVGANVGLYTAELVRTFGAQATIWSFEPASETFAILERNAGSLPNVHLVPLGLGDQAGTVRLYSAGRGSTYASVYDVSARLERSGLMLAETESIELTTLDEFCETQGIEHVDFLKLDVEGNELKVLQGAERMLRRSRIGAIQFEVGAPSIDSRTYLRDFFELLSPMYTLHRVLKDGLIELDEYRELYEVFKRSTNYVALLRERHRQ